MELKVNSNFIFVRANKCTGGYHSGQQNREFFFSWFLHAPKVFCFPGFYMRLFSYPSGFVVSLRSRKKFLSFALPSYFFLVLLHPIVYGFVCSIVPPLSWFFKYTLLVQRGILSLSLSRILN